MNSLRIAATLARRELSGGLKGFRIFLACLTLGVAAIAAVQSVSSAITAGLQRDGRILLGGDIAFQKLYTGISREQHAYIKRGTERISRFVETRTMGRRDGGDAGTLIELKAVDDSYPLFGEMTLHDGASFSDSLTRQQDRWGVVIDSALQQRLQVTVGDALHIGEGRFTIRGIIKREPDRAAGRFGFWPRVLMHQEALPTTGLIREGSMLYYQYRLKLAAGMDPGRYVKELNTAFPDNRWQIRDYRNAAPGLERAIERLKLFLTLVGLTALLVGGVGVSNAVTAYLDTKLNTIATLKCLGAQNHILFLTYLLQLLVLAGIGIVIGLLAGAATPPIAGILLSQLVPVPIQAGIYPGALLLAALFGLLTVLTFAVWPLASAHEIPAGALFRARVVGAGRWPRWPYIALTAASTVLLAGLVVLAVEHQGFAVWFVLGALAAIAAFRATAWAVMRVSRYVSRPRRPGVRLALANLHRPDTPAPTVMLSLGLGLTVLVTVVLIEGNLDRQIQEGIPEKAPAFFFIDVRTDQMEAFGTALSAIEGTTDLMKMPFLRGHITGIKGLEPEQALVREEEAWMIRGDRGLTYAAKVPENATLIAGEWWPEAYAGPPLLSVHKDFAEGFDVGIGDTISLRVSGRDITATVANIRDLEWRTLQINFTMMLSPEPLRRAPHSFIATVAADDGAEAEIQRVVARTFPNVMAVRIKEVLGRIHELMNNLGTATKAMAAITLLAGTLVLAGAMAAGHRRRIYDSVVLKVLGATRRDIAQAFLLEYGLLGLITALIAALVGSIASWAILTQVMGSAWTFLPSEVILTTILCTTITLGLGFLSTWRALGQKAAPLLRNE